MSNQTATLDLSPKLPELDQLLIALLKELSPQDWEKPTIAPLWRVKDIVAHLLDGNIRILSMLRDNYYGEKPEGHSYPELLLFLNRLNADWVQAMKRVSPEVLILLHEVTGPLFCDYYGGLDPFGKSPFPVSWAGEEESKNWMHIAREYTEKFLHQQQIRQALDKPGLLNRDLYHPFLETCLYAWPFAFQEVLADEGTRMALEILGDAGGIWYLSREEEKWMLSKEKTDELNIIIRILPEDAWIIFSKKELSPEIRARVAIEGNQSLGAKVLEVKSFMI